MTDHQQTSVEAAKLVKEWSIWMVTVQSGLSAYLTFFTDATKGKHVATNVATVADVTDRVAVASFVISILAASAVLSGLPFILCRIPDIERPHIYEMKLWSAAGLNRVQLWHMGTVQHWAFAIGLISLIAGRLYCGNS